MLCRSCVCVCEIISKAFVSIRAHIVHIIFVRRIIYCTYNKLLSPETGTQQYWTFSHWYTNSTKAYCTNLLPLLC